MTPTFSRDIRPLFREEDVSAMQFALDLAAYEDVRAAAEEIYERLEDGTMPCDRVWPPEWVAVFRGWIDGGMPR